LQLPGKKRKNPQRVGGGEFSPPGLRMVHSCEERGGKRVKGPGRREKRLRNEYDMEQSDQVNAAERDPCNISRGRGKGRGEAVQKISGEKTLNQAITLRGRRSDTENKSSKKPAAAEKFYRGMSD